MGRLSDLVGRAIESRRSFWSRGSSADSVYSIPPLLSCSFDLEFVISPSVSLWGCDFLMTDLNGLDGGLSWSPHSSEPTIMMPNVNVSYFTLQYFISSSIDRTTAQAFPSMYLYENQFTDDGLLRIPVSTSRSYSRYRDAYTRLRAEMSDVSSRGGYLTDSDLTMVRPYIRLWLRYPQESYDYSQESGSDGLLLCTFSKCVFGTPKPSFALGRVDGMTWTQQVGYRVCKWGRRNDGSFFSRVGSSAPDSTAVVSSRRDD